jgi:hypothetical protein
VARADDLQADRQPGSGRAARDGDRGLLGEVEDDREDQVGNWAARSVEYGMPDSAITLSASSLALK